MNQFIKSHGEINNYYLSKIRGVLDKALYQHSAVAVFRFDLRLPIYVDSDMPESFANTGPEVISRFIDKIKERLWGDLENRRKEGKQVYPHRFRYAWVREYNQEGKPHYHVMIFLNKQNYAYFGDYDSDNKNLATRIQSAWCSALGVDYDTNRTLVHFPKNPCDHININASEYDLDCMINKVMYRASYLAKQATKVYSSHYRSFGCSQY